MEWNIAELKALVTEQHGIEQASMLEPCLESIKDRQRYLRYHFDEAKSSLKDVVFSCTENSSIMKAIFDEAHSGPNNKREYSKLKMEANLIGCVQSLHTIPDILSHVIYYSLNFNFETPLAENQVKPEKILGLMKHKSKLCNLKELFRSIIKNENYDYLSALVNHSKHKSIIKPIYTLRLTKSENNKQEIEFGEFRKNRKCYPSKPAFEFIEAEFERQTKIIIEAGNELNFILNSKKGTFNCD